MATSGDDTDQLELHVNLGLKNGLKREELIEAITHLVLHAGCPKAYSALPVAAGDIAGVQRPAPKR